MALLLALAVLDGSRSSAAAHEHFPVPHARPVSQAAARPAPLYAAWTDSIIGNRSRMIQVGTVVIVIAIFILTRSTK
jgi:hypothetical protein